MTTFEVGKKYYDTSACDHNCVFVVEIVKRTAKTVTFRRDGQERRAKIYTDSNGEYIIPERYSMAPVFRASREYVEAPEEAEEATAAPDPMAAYIPQAAQPADHPSVVMVGQPVVGNWGRHVSHGYRRDRRFRGADGYPLDPRHHHGGDPLGRWPHLHGGPGGHTPPRVAFSQR